MNKINFQKFQVDQENRQITFSCCTTTPYQRYDQKSDIAYNQILVINQQAVDLSRLNNSAPLLFNHDVDRLLGVVESAWIVEDRVYVRVRFSPNDQFSDRIYKDILDNLIRNVSIGYTVEAYQDKKENGINNRYVTKWMIYETSIVSIPADCHCGIRNLNTKDINNMECAKEDKQLVQEQIEKEVFEQKIENEQPKKQQVIEQVIDQQADQIQRLKIENQALKDEIAKIKEQPKEEIKEQIEKEVVQEVKEQVIDEQTKVEIEKMGEDFNVPQEQIRSALDKKLTVKEFKQIIKQKSFNIKSKEDKKMNKKQFAAFLSERNFDKPFVMRDFTGFADQALIGTETTPLVAALDKRLGVKGYRALNGLRSNISIPVQSTRLTVGEAGICEPATDSNPQFENVELTPHKITGSVLICKEMLANTNSDVQAFIIDSLLKQITYKIEAMMLGKVAEAAATEINYASVNAVTWADILAMQAAIDGYLVDNTAYVMSPSARAALKATPKAENTIAGFICEGNEVNGYRVNVSGVVDNDNIYYGDWNELVLGTWGQGIQVLVDPYSEARAGNVVIVASALVDAAVVQKNAFCIGRVQENSSESSSSEASV